MTYNKYVALFFIFFVLICSQAIAQTAIISTGSGSGLPGDNVDISLQIDPGSTEVSSLQFDLVYPSTLSHVSSTGGEILSAAGKSLSSNSTANGVRFIVFGLNTNTISAGVICEVRFSISPDAIPGSLTIAVENFVVSDPDAAKVSGSSTSGSITVLAPPDTVPPGISGVTSSNVTESGATISWSTNEAATAQVEYGLTTGYGSTTAIDGTLKTSHTRILVGLTEATTYHYRVISKDEAGNTAESGDYTFTTLEPADTTPPEISAVTSSNVTETGATISWNTDEAATARVEYGTTTGYGSTTAEDSSLKVAHTRVLEGLTEATTYHYRVISTDEAG
ncbi:MAG: fibronectin type III domain-containing protein, partial [Acidobacteriota bacterium]